MNIDRSMAWFFMTLFYLEHDKISDIAGGHMVKQAVVL